MKPILVVDDEAIMRESLHDWLTDLGYQVETAEEGEQALRSFAEQDFGVAIVDLKLPGKSGIDVLREARAKRPDLKGIIITAYPSIRTAVQSMKEGAVDYLPKPFDLDELGRLIQEALGAPLPAAAVAALPVEAETREKGSRVEAAVDKSGKVCLPPCQMACPIGENIQRTNVMLASLPQGTADVSRRIIDIGDEIYDQNPLFMVCSYICGLCERQCNYKDQGGAIRRKMLKRLLAEYYLPYLKTKAPFPYPPREKVAVVGGGPGGLMCGYLLGKKGYQVTILERDTQLGGALRNIPRYRLPTDVIDSTVDNLVRLAHIDVRFGVEVGSPGKTLDDIKRGGYQAIFVATGTPSPRPLTFAGELVTGADLDGVASGLNLLYAVNQGRVPNQLFRQLFSGKRVIVVGGGNVAFDVARTVRRLGGDVSMVCLECEDKSSKDGIPADVEEVEGARQEGITITYCRGVEQIMGAGGKFSRIKCPRCVSVFDDKGFNPRFNREDVIYLEGDVLLVTIGQGAERGFLQQEDLLNDRGRLDVDPVSLMSNRRAGIFLGGDLKQIGFAADAMRDGMIVAESVDRYLRGGDLRAGRERQYQAAPIPELGDYQPQPRLDWVLMKEKLSFEMFERGFTLEEAIKEAGRCLYCGPCRSCKACIALELQGEIAQIEVNPEVCSGCGVCLGLCTYQAPSMAESANGRVMAIDELRCKRCGVCVSACPAGAVSISDDLGESIAEIYDKYLA